MGILNLIEKQIEGRIKKECRPRQAKLWGQPCDISPAFVSKKIGDGLQLIWLQTLDCRPDYYVLRIDSKMNIDAEDFDTETLFVAIEEEYDDVASYECKLIDNEYKYRRYFEEENEPWHEYPDFPVLSTASGWSCGLIHNFGNHKKLNPSPTNKQ